MTAGALDAALAALQAVALLGPAVTGTVAAASLAAAARSLREERRAAAGGALPPAALRELPKPISLLVPARNEEAAIAGAVGALLDLDYPEFEVIVVSDGSGDGTVRALVEAYALEPVPDEPYRGVAHGEVRGAWRSARFPQLVLLDKAGGGRADALNAGLNRARYPLACVVDVGARLDGEALLRAALRFVLDDDLVALAGAARTSGAPGTRHGPGPSDGGPSGGGAGAARASPRWIERFGAIERVRSSLARDAASAAADMLLVPSGPFRLFRRQALLDLGGWRADLVDADAELIVRAHHAYRLADRPCRVGCAVDPLGWAPVPPDLASARRWHARRQRGTLEALREHSAMLLAPRHGRLGAIAMPGWWLADVVAPFLEIGGWLLFLLLAATGRLEPAFAAAFLSLAVAYGALTSVAAFALETLLRERRAAPRERRLLFAAALLENLGYRQLIAWTRLVASLRYRPSASKRASNASSR